MAGVRRVSMSMSRVRSKIKPMAAGRGTARVEIRALQHREELRECERIQRAVWGTLAVSSETLTVTARYGGAVLGAIVKGRIVGFIYAFLARWHGRLVHWSHLMAVEASYRDLGLGYRLKLAHRRLALDQGLEAICWTYDPLQSRNASLNLARLGGTVYEYLPDCYGRFRSRIEKGLPSDRFVVDWKIGSAVVDRRIRGLDDAPKNLGAAVVNETRIEAGGFLKNRTIRLGMREPRLLVEIPSNTDLMRRRALALGRRWRLETRKIFSHYFSAGYRVDDFISPAAASEGRCYYVLRRTRAVAPLYERRNTRGGKGAAPFQGRLRAALQHLAT